MKNRLLIFLSAFILLIGCSQEKSEKPTTPLSEQELQFEIYDSLVVDYLGNLTLMDINPAGNRYLLIDQNTEDILVTDPKGTILHQYNLSQEGPDQILGNRLGVAKFMDNEKYLVPGSKGLTTYMLDGKRSDSFKPEFTGLSSLVIPSSQSHYVWGNQVIVQMPGRFSDLGQQGIDLQLKSKRLEMVDLNTGEYQAIIPFPQESKFNSETKEYGALDFYCSFTVSGDSLHLSFRNEAKIFSYSLKNLENPPLVKPIPIPNFQGRNTDKKPTNGGFNARDFFLGSINSVLSINQEELLISYLPGLDDETANQIISEAGSDFNKMFDEAGKLNKGGLVVFDGKSISKLIEIPEILGSLNKVKSREEIWFSLNFSEAENDYSVIYKTRLVNK